mgnify:CR=1 FL=1
MITIGNLIWVIGIIKIFNESNLYQRTTPIISLTISYTEVPEVLTFRQNKIDIKSIIFYLL